MIQRTENLPLTVVKLLPDMSKEIFQQGDAPAYPTSKAQRWCQTGFLGTWEKGKLPGNNPDSSTIENLYVIVQDKVGKMELATSESTLIENLRSSWLSISAWRWRT